MRSPARCMIERMIDVCFGEMQMSANLAYATCWLRLDIGTPCAKDAKTTEIITMNIVPKGSVVCEGV